MYGAKSTEGINSFLFPQEFKKQQDSANITVAGSVKKRFIFITVAGSVKKCFIVINVAGSVKKSFILLFVILLD
jgi:hypothetical protein